MVWGPGGIIGFRMATIALVMAVSGFAVGVGMTWSEEVEEPLAEP